MIPTLLAVVVLVQPPPVPALEPAGALRVFQLVRQMASEDRGALWGRSIDGPILLVDPATRRVLADRPGVTGRWAALGEVYSGQLPPEVGSANTAVTLDGERWTMVMWPLPDDPMARRQLLAHELWHRIQDSIGLPMRDPPNPQVDDEQGRVLLRLETRALARALGSTGPDRATALVAALGFRATRQRRYPGSDSTEALIERNEGLAEYTGVRMAGGTAAARRAVVTRALTELETREHLTRSFAYTTGPAYGLLLDELRPGWRLELRTGQGPAALARRAVGVTLFDDKRMALEEGRLGGPMIRAEEARRAEAQAARRRDLVGRFVTGPILTIPLVKSSISFDPNQVEGLDSLGTHYGTLELSGSWGVLQAPGGGRVSAGWTTVHVPVGPGFTGADRKGPGWSLDLRPGWRIVPDSIPGHWRVTGESSNIP